MASKTSDRMLVALTQSMAIYGESERLGKLSELVKLRKSLQPSATDADSLNIGLKERPLDILAAKNLKRFSEHHEACINAKVSACVGLGFCEDMEQTGNGAGAMAKAAVAPPTAATPGLKHRPTSTQRLMSKADVVLDPLCDHSIQHILSCVAQDYYEAGSGYIEVVRRKRSNEIVAMYHRPASEVRVYVDGPGMWHYQINSSESSWLTNRASGNEYHLARFGETSKIALELAGNSRVKLESQRRGVYGSTRGYYREIIDILCPSSESRWYGVPRYLSALPLIDLKRAINQYYADFFHNHGVPDLLVLFSGAQLSDDQWKAVQAKFNQTKGLGNQHKTMTMNIANQEIKLQVEKLAMEMKTDSLATSADAMNLSIVTAHGVPPLLAGIQTPGKLGANNELPNALQAFQALVIGGDQRIWQQRLGRTLGSDEAGLGLTLKDFQFYTILDEIDIGTSQTVAGMKQPLAEANAQGRDLTAGMKH